jgi:hypothetical protein
VYSSGATIVMGTIKPRVGRKSDPWFCDVFQGSPVPMTMMKV